MFGSIKVACAQTRSVPIKGYGILGGRGVGKGARPPNCWKFTPMSGAEALSNPFYTKYKIYIKCENVRLQSRGLALILEVCQSNATGFSGVGVQGREPGLKIVGNLHRILAPTGGQGSKSGPIYTDFWLRGAECTPSLQHKDIILMYINQHQYQHNLYSN